MEWNEVTQFGENVPEYTVSEISSAIRKVVENDFGRVRVRGEIGRVARPSSGHIYLDLKDDRSVLAGVIWRNTLLRSSTMPEEGMEVIAIGRLTTFSAQSKYQIIVEDIRPAGVGALMAMLEKRKLVLTKEGLFSGDSKQKLPYLPKIIGVITSPTGAVIRDILHRLADRFPRRVLVWPVAVQGESCVSNVVNALRGFNKLVPEGPIPKPDLLIVARGGGAIEDLWSFNDEAIVRAVAESEIPVISAIGHETDTTLIDLAADMRAPTPTAAAELAVPVRIEILADVEENAVRLARGLSLALRQRQQRLSDLQLAIPKPRNLLNSERQRVDFVTEKLCSGLERSVQKQQLKLAKIAGTIRPQVLERQNENYVDRLTILSSRLKPALLRHLKNGKDELRQQVIFLKQSSSILSIKAYEKELKTLSQRLHNGIRGQNKQRCARLDVIVKMHAMLGYRATLERGFAVIRGENGVITRKVNAQDVKTLEIEFLDGRLHVKNNQEE
ncbi:MAG: exodeoxyribonuclease VII large subunit [Aestuariivita sp.]|nr:exodeoxyribonuclease VII large subunit [Aestuariivita sp.]